MMLFSSLFFWNFWTSKKSNFLAYYLVFLIIKVI
uniref:Uncharacterized protein n=1 Tax=Physcomitrium patens TaxID=3218 RepID=A0A2K1J2K7_PHYPA|nr:hypothetical protein PHYPA_021612 [Physcomitrium patens]